MFTYEIPMKFRYLAKNADYKKFTNEFDIAQSFFNDQAEKMKKARKILEIKYPEEGIIVILESKDQLINPSRALAVFSRKLSEMDTLKGLKDRQNHLLCGNGQISEIRKEDDAFNVSSTSEILKTVIDIFMVSSAADSAFVSKGRQDAQEKIIEACKEFRSLV